MMKLIIFLSLLGFALCNPLRTDKIRNFCAECITSLCDKLKECGQILKHTSKSKNVEYNKKRDMLDFDDWTKNQVGISYKMNQKYIKKCPVFPIYFTLHPNFKLPMPDCLGTLVSPKIVLTDATCVVPNSKL